MRPCDGEKLFELTGTQGALCAPAARAIDAAASFVHIIRRRAPACRFI